MNHEDFKPNLAAKAVLDELRYPMLASPKLDGIRAAIVNGKLLSRTLKPIPNKHIRTILESPELEGFDGELIAGDPWSKTAYRDTVSIVMSHDKEPTDVRFYCFDLWNMPHPYHARWHQLEQQGTASWNQRVDVVEQIVINNEAELMAYEASALAKGFEGVMLRDPNGLYKFGRSSMKDQGIVKLKRFVDGEATIIGIEEEMFNGNEAETNELGRTKRSTTAAGLVGKGSMGAIVVEDVETKVVFNIGTGFDAADRVDFWHNNRIGQIVKYKHFPIGTKDKPRHPVYLGMRPSGA